MAHRTQLRTRGRLWSRPNGVVELLTSVVEGPRLSIEKELSFSGFPDETRRLGWKHKYNMGTKTSRPAVPELKPQRSQRIRKEKFEECYIYKK